MRSAVAGVLRTYPHGAFQAVGSLQNLQPQVLIEVAAQDALHLVERLRVGLTREERGQPMLDEEDLALALEFRQPGQGRAEQGARVCRVLRRVERRQRLLDPALGQSRVAHEALE